MNPPPAWTEGIRRRDAHAIGRAISLLEENAPDADALLDALDPARFDAATILGVTGPPGVGKSTLVDQLIRWHRAQGRRVGVIAVDPSSPLTGGAVLGDRVRMMRHATDPDVIVRSMAQRGRLGGLCAAAGGALRVLAEAGCDPLFIETVGIGQAEADVARLADLTLLVLAPGFGDDVQAMKAGVIELADVLVVNKSDLPGVDTLMADLHALIEGGTRALCSVCATTGEGIDPLAKSIAAINEQRRSSGKHSERRRHFAAAEALDAAMETVRVRLTERLPKLAAVERNPRKLARRLLDGLNIDDLQ